MTFSGRKVRSVTSIEPSPEMAETLFEATAHDCTPGSSDGVATVYFDREADDLGDLKILKLGEAPVADLATLGKRLRLYTQLLEGKPLRVRLVADDSLRYEPAARIIATCSAAGVAAIRLTQPGATPSLPGGGERPAGIGATRPANRSGSRQ